MTQFMVDLMVDHSYYRPFLVGALSFRIPLILPSSSRTKSCKEERKMELDSCPNTSANVQLNIQYVSLMV